MENIAWIVLLLGIAAVILWIYAIVQIVRGSLGGNGNKILWLLVVIFFPIVGALLFLLIGKK